MYLLCQAEFLVCSKQGFFPFPATPGQLTERFAFPLVLLAAIFSSNMAPEDRTGKKTGDSPHISAHFPPISAKMGTGTGKWSQNWGDPGVFPYDVF